MISAVEPLAAGPDLSATELRKHLIELRKTMFLIKVIVLPEDVPWTDDQLIAELLKKFPPQ